MVLFFILLIIFAACLIALVIMVIQVIRSGRTITPRQAIRMFEKIDQQRRRR